MLQHKKARIQLKNQKPESHLDFSQNRPPVILSIVYTPQIKSDIKIIAALPAYLLQDASLKRKVIKDTYLNPSCWGSHSYLYPPFLPVPSLAPSVAVVRMHNRTAVAARGVLCRTRRRWRLGLLPWFRILPARIPVRRGKRFAGASEAEEE